MRIFKKLMVSGILLILAAGSLLTTGCGSNNPTSSPNPTPTPYYSTSGVTVMSLGGSPSGIYNYNSYFWIMVGPTSLGEYNPSGTAVTTITKAGPGSLGNSPNVAVGPDDSVYVGDLGNSQIDVFTVSGTTASFSTSITGLTGVSDMAVNAAGTTLYVLTNANPGAIMTYSITGATYPKTFTYVSTFSTTSSGAGALNNARCLTLDTASNVYVANYRTGNVVKYDPTGSNPVSFGSAALSYPYGIAVNSDGAVLVSACDNPGFIQEFTPSGSTYAAGVTFGNNLLVGPEGITLDPSRNLYVSNFTDNQIVEFQYNP
jgi:serine/threonine-protein kinase